LLSLFLRLRTQYSTTFALFKARKNIRMKRKYLLLLAASALLVVFYACNPANNTLINRTYHSTTARYNGYFNANLLLEDAMSSFRNNLREDYYNILTIEVYPDEKQVLDMYSPIDTAIAKCTKVIQEHSMPGSSKPSTKKEENNTYIDENWITIGIASYIRRDYSAAMKNFQFIKKFYTNDESNFVGELWMAKTNIAIKKYTEAGFNLDVLKNAMLAEKERSRDRFKIPFIDKLTGKKSKKKSKKSDEPEIAEIPKEIYYQYHIVRAELASKKKDKETMLSELLLALDEVKKKKDKARILYIIGQLYEEQGNRFEAKDYYAKVLKCNAAYDMTFSARLKRAFLGGDAKLVKELNKMLIDAKNAEYKDQIYYALAQIELQNNNETKVFQYLTASAFYSTSNRRQKAMAYEQMGDIRFKKKSYIPAQKYYDSCSTFMPESYPNAEAIKNKATKLSDLVKAVETAAYEDSVQKIAKLNESDREAFIENVIVQLKEREAERKRKEAERLAALQKNENTFNQTANGNKWYFRNAKTRAEGYDEFKRLWGQIENEDNWRRSDKIVMAAFVDPNDTTTQIDNSVIPVAKQDTLTVDLLMKGIPLTDSALAVSRERLVKSLYDAGIIYKDQLNEPTYANTQFNAVVNKTYESDYKLMSAYQLYNMNEKGNPSMADLHKTYILNNYPDSDYANFLRDPDYFIKKKQLDAVSEKKYIQTLDRYRNGLYYPALTEAEAVIVGEPQNYYRSKYLLLKAMCQGKLNNDKNTMIPTLNQIIKEFPSTSEEKRAQEMLSIIQNGYSKNEVVDFTNKSPYRYNDKKQFVIIFLPDDENSGLAKQKISDFSREYFSRQNLKINSKLYGDMKSIVLIEDFKTDLEAKEYVRTYKATRKHLLDLQNAKLFAITQENLKTLFETQKLKEYEDFYDQYY
jgi:hypothetical protein